jgi:ribulose 1,5-bisphosphate carboxylase large subunit-like protein
MASWINICNVAPKINQAVRVKDTQGGQEYVARWNGPNYGWTILNFPQGLVPNDRPQFWLSQ